ncbi:MAG TPA: hypothetical protein VFX96_19665, partial [Pyrinomonadaceae bacterium]|nr:hypothetical protein [Pyrinomonadaceae bacterium]
MKLRSVLLAAFVLLFVHAVDVSAATQKRRPATPKKRAGALFAEIGEDRRSAPASKTRAKTEVEYLKNVGSTRSLPFSEAVRVGRMLYLS